MSQGTGGVFWSIGANSTAAARYLDFYGSNVDPESSNHKSYGFPVRCEIYYRKFPFTLTYGGNVDRASGSTVGQGASGYFWSIGATTRTDASYLGFRDSTVYPELSYYKSSGFPVRCKNILHQSSHSRLRMEAASIPRLDLRWLRARTATSGLYALTRRSTLGACSSMVAASTQRATPISPTVGPSAAKYITDKFPSTLTYGGRVDRTSGSTVAQGTGGSLWSIGTNSASYARYLNFYGSDVYPEYDAYKSLGFSVRSEILYYRQVPIHAYVWRLRRSRVWLDGGPGHGRLLLVYRC